MSGSRAGSGGLSRGRGCGSMCPGLERKNGWTLAEWAGEVSPDGMQRLLRRADWDVDGVRDDVRAYVVEQLGEPDGVLIADDTGFLGAPIGSPEPYPGHPARPRAIRREGRTLGRGELGHPSSSSGSRPACRRAPDRCWRSSPRRARRRFPPAPPARRRRGPESWIRWARQKAIDCGAIVTDGQVTAIPEPWPRRDHPGPAGAGGRARGRRGRRRHRPQACPGTRRTGRRPTRSCCGS
jgi:hypothetical protein